MASALVFVSKYVGETKRFNFDFTSQLRAGEALANLSVTVVVYSGEDDEPYALLSGIPTFSGAVASQNLIGGLSGVEYRVTCLATTTLGNSLAMVAHLALLPSSAGTVVIPPPEPPPGIPVDLVGDLVPSGAATRAGSLFCDGSAVSRTTYSNLFAAIGTTFGSGNGSTTFNIPDCRGRGLLGAGTGSGLTARTLGQIGGVETVTLSAVESGIATHTHIASGVGSGDPPDVWTVPNDDDSVPQGQGLSYKQSDNLATARSINSSGNALVDLSGFTVAVTVDAVSAAPAASAHQNMQPFLVINWFIVY